MPSRLAHLDNAMQGIIFRDIKPENLLVDEQGRVKLCDAGFARYGSVNERLTDYVATRWWVVPLMGAGAGHVATRL